MLRACQDEIISSAASLHPQSGPVVVAHAGCKPAILLPLLWECWCGSPQILASFMLLWFGLSKDLRRQFVSPTSLFCLFGRVTWCIALLWSLVTDILSGSLGNSPVCQGAAYFLIQAPYTNTLWNICHNSQRTWKSCPFEVIYQMWFKKV